MVNEKFAPNDPYSSTTNAPSTTINPNQGYPAPRGEDGRSSRDTVTAITVAILAVIMVITIILVIHAIRKLRRARRRRDRPIPAISTEILEARMYSKFIYR
jgi:heme/copper-type cytochrome/quinol oxidase subunit 2